MFILYKLFKSSVFYPNNASQLEHTTVEVLNSPM